MKQFLCFVVLLLMCITAAMAQTVITPSSVIQNFQMSSSGVLGQPGYVVLEGYSNWNTSRELSPDIYQIYDGDRDGEPELVATFSGIDPVTMQLWGYDGELKFFCTEVGICYYTASEGKIEAKTENGNTLFTVKETPPFGKIYCDKWGERFWADCEGGVLTWKIHQIW